MSEFVCGLEPRGDGGWDVWITEKPYRGIHTDAVLGQVGERKRIGSAWTSRYYVGRKDSEKSARKMAARALADCARLARQEEAEASAWQQNAAREPICMTSLAPSESPRESETSSHG